MYEHTPTESTKRGTLLRFDKNLKYKLRQDLNKGMIDSTFVEIVNKNEKIMVTDCIYTINKEFLTFWITHCLF